MRCQCQCRCHCDQQGSAVCQTWLLSVAARPKTLPVIRVVLLPPPTLPHLLPFKPLNLKVTLSHLSSPTSTVKPRWSSYKIWRSRYFGALDHTWWSFSPLFMMELSIQINWKMDYKSTLKSLTTRVAASLHLTVRALSTFALFPARPLFCPPSHLWHIIICKMLFRSFHLKWKNPLSLSVSSRVSDKDVYKGKWF